MTQRWQRVPFSRERERAWWLLVVACAAAGLWAVAQVLAWPIPARAALAAVAAAVALIVPELRARRAAIQRKEQLVARLEVHGRTGWLPEVSEVSDRQLRVHSSRVDLPYIERDKQQEVDSALIARRPLLIVGHSMAGKTRLAASRVRKLYCDAALLAPLSGAALRELVEAGVDLAGTVVWLDDFDRFLTGDMWLDPGLLDTLVTRGAVVVATIRRNALTVYRPRDKVRPPQWETISRFTRVDLSRRLSAEESRIVKEQIADSELQSAIHRYGLAEYLGAGPDAVERLDSGDTECPVGAALVRGAIDWRRAGLVRLVRRRDLCAALPIYLRDRPDVATDDASVTAGLNWATEKVNETVSLLMPDYRVRSGNADAADQNGDLPLFEVFDYLVDVLEDRAASLDRAQRDAAIIPIDMYRLVVERASRAERSDVEIAARNQSRFVGRTEEIAELTSWLAGPLGSSSPLGILHGMGGVGKSAILRRLQELADPRTRELIAGDPTQPLVNVPRFDLVLSARGRSVSELLAALCSAAGLEPVSDETDDVRAMRLQEALHGRQRPVLVAIDGLDEAVDPEAAMRALLDLYRAHHDLPLRILISTRQHPPMDLALVRVVEVSVGPRQDVVEAVRDRLDAARGSGSAELTDETAEVIADLAGGYFLVATLIAAGVGSGALPSDPAALAQALRGSWSQPHLDATLTIRATVEQWLASLGDRKQDALVLLRALAQGPALGMTTEEWLAAASRLANRPYTKADLEWLSQGGLIGRQRDDGTYRLHPLARTFVEGYQDPETRDPAPQHGIP